MSSTVPEHISTPTLESASDMLQHLMTTTFYPVYRLDGVGHEFRAEQNGTAVYSAGQRMGDAHDADGLHEAWTRLSQEVAPPELDLCSRMFDDYRVPGIAAQYLLSQLLSGARGVLQEAYDRGDSFITRWWIAEEGSEGMDARCGFIKALGQGWAEVRQTQALDALAQAAARRVISEAPTTLNEELQAGVERQGSHLAALAERYDMTLPDILATIEEEGFPVVYAQGKLVEFPVRGNEVAAAEYAIDELTEEIGQRLNGVFEKLVALLRGDLYDPTAVEPDLDFMVAPSTHQ